MSNLEPVQRPLPYVDRLDSRSTQSINLVVIHCTELPTLQLARDYGERVLYDSGTGNSGHFYVDRDGTIEQWVPLNRVAHHVKGFNDSSVGIELINRGRYPDWFASDNQEMPEPYPADQVEALIRLLNDLAGELPALEFITGHEQLDTDTVPASDNPRISVRRKRDPGPLFPWPAVLKSNRLEWLEEIQG